MMRAVGTKKNSAARIQSNIEDGPLWAAAAIQRGPSTAAMLNSRTSQKPISRRSSLVAVRVITSWVKDCLGAGVKHAAYQLCSGAKNLAQKLKPQMTHTLDRWLSVEICGKSFLE